MVFLLLADLTYDLRIIYDNEGKRQKSLDGKEFNERADKLPSVSSKWHRQEVHHVAFLKVHKTASSTAQNVFLRFGDSRKLTFILAHTHGESNWLNVISYKNSINENNVVPPPPGKIYDLLCCHVIYDRESFEKVLPNDTTYIGIVREPYSRFQSAIKYFSPRHIMSIEGNRPVSTYAQDPLKYEPLNPRLSPTNNRMAVEFGFPDRLFPGKEANASKAEIDTYLKKIDNEFQFIIISELFEESMVYMRRALCWTTKDVLFMDKNKSSLKQDPRKIMTEDDNKLLSKFLYLDIALYEFAMKRFDEQIKKEGKDFQNELAHFKDIKQKANDFCLQGTQANIIFFGESRWDKGFNLTKADCKLFSMWEIDFIQKERMRLYGTLDN